MSITISSPHYVQKIWGGNFLSRTKGVELKGLPLGESLEISKLNGHSSIINGEALEDSLSDEELPYLVKFIDTSDYLSVQVHPDNDYARKNENSFGKSECWIILEAQEGEGIFLGFKKDTKPDEFKQAVDDQIDLTKFLKFYEVKRGDFFYVPAGTIHAIGKGIVLAEVQQNSGVTYRVWDWNRVDSKGQGRELHIDKAMDVLNFENSLNTDEVFKYKKEVLKGTQELIGHNDFVLSTYVLNAGEVIEIPQTGSKRKRSIICLKGALEFDSSSVRLTEYCSGIFLTNNKVCITADETSEFLVIR